MNVDDEVDILGVGFGPSNAALAIALEEYRAAAPDDALRVLFVERSPRMTWHEGMLLDDASMQVSFLKDLATFRNPTSPYTFVNFLKSVDRLADFTNRASFTPLRVEFVAYLRWVADQLAHLVRYGTTVRSVAPVVVDGRVEGFDVVLTGGGLSDAGPGEGGSGDVSRGDVADSGDDPVRALGTTTRTTTRTVRARHVVVASGLRPRLPEGVVAGPRVLHTASFLPGLRALGGGDAFVVVGAGQSAAEAALHLYGRFPDATVHLVTPQFGLAPADQGPLVNQIFDPATVDLVYDAPPDARDRLARLHANSNYAAASPQVVRELFETGYRDRWLGAERLVLHRASRVEGVVADADGVDVTVRGLLDGRVHVLRADAAVLGTGYRPGDGGDLLGEHGALLDRDARGRVVVERDHRARLRLPGDAGLYLVGQSEHQHGIAATLLSVVAVRAGELADSLVSAHLIDTRADAREGSHV